MKIRKDGKCDQCGKSLVDKTYEGTHTHFDRDFCDYECMGDFYGSNREIPEKEDFICVRV